MGAAHKCFADSRRALKGAQRLTKHEDTRDEASRASASFVPSFSAFVARTLERRHIGAARAVVGFLLPLPLKKRRKTMKKQQKYCANTLVLSKKKRKLKPERCRPPPLSTLDVGAHLGKSWHHLLRVLAFQNRWHHVCWTVRTKNKAVALLQCHLKVIFRARGGKVYEGRGSLFLFFSIPHMYRRVLTDLSQAPFKGTQIRIPYAKIALSSHQSCEFVPLCIRYATRQKRLPLTLRLMHTRTCVLHRVLQITPQFFIISH